MNFRPVLYVVGIALCVLAASMALPLMTDLHARNPDWRVFLLCMMFTAFFGGLLTLVNAGESAAITHRQGFMMITLCGLALSLFAALPFWFSDMQISFTNAVFESVSGITTTGATVLTGLDNASRGILLWRALLQWLGGVGGIMMALSILPFLKIGGMQLFETELSETEKTMPRTTQLALVVGGIYIMLTGANAVAYHLAGLGLFDSLAHAMTTISTGGFSTHDSSLGQYNSAWVEIVAIVFMFAGSLPFMVYLKALRGNLKPLFTDTQMRFLLSVIITSAAVLAVYLILIRGMDAGAALLQASFNVVSTVTGTGFANGGYSIWGGFAAMMFFFLMIVGGCAGSTAGGIKIFRFQVLYSLADTQIRKLMHPSGVFIPQYNRKPVPESVAISVMSFFFLYALSFSLVAAALSFTGLDFMTALSGSAASISNAGPGMGSIISPTGAYQPLPDSAKWVLSGAMLLGRLELFPILVLLSPQFWQR